MSRAPADLAARARTLTQRVRRALRRHGVRGALVRAWHRALTHAFLDERHVWYALDLDGAPPTRPIPPGITLRRGVEADIELLRQLETTSPAEALTRIRVGSELWLAQDGDDVMFSCWIFRERTPTIASESGWLTLPPATVCLEDSVTSPAARGRGIAPASWAAIAQTLASEGQRQMITKVETDNTASRRAVEKAGFKAVAVMRVIRVGPQRRTAVKLLDAEHGAFLAERLGRGVPAPQRFRTR